MDRHTANLLPLIRVRDFVPGEPCVTAILKWHAKGIAMPDGTRVKLEVIHVGDTHRTTLEAMHRFIAECNADTSSPLNYRGAEELILLKEAARQLAVARTTVLNWATFGIKSPTGKRIFLDTIKIGGYRYTSIQAVDRFYTQCNKEE
jgi:hypothetical protein